MSACNNQGHLRTVIVFLKMMTMLTQDDQDDGDDHGDHGDHHHDFYCRDPTVKVIAMS